MPYITGGISWTEINVKEADSKGIYSLLINKDKKLLGWTVGTGIELAINRKLHLRLQYRYTDYGRNSFSFKNPWSGNGKVEIDYNSHTVSIGFSYHF